MGVIDVNQGDYMGGEVEPHVLGKREEQAARVHAPQQPKPKLTKRADIIKFEIEERMELLRPALDEYERCQRAVKALKRI